MEKRKKKKRSFSHLDQAQRDRLEIMLREGRKQKDIADVLGIDPGTVSREKRRKRKRQRVYKAAVAQQKANAERACSKYCGMAVESDRKRKQYIIEQLEQLRSPDEIAGRIKLEKIYEPIGKDAIYSWLYSTRGGRYAKLLCTMRKKKKPHKKTGKREMIPNRISLKDRPRRGVHAQGDAFLSSKKDGTAGGIMVVIPSVQLLLSTKTPNLSPRTYTPRVDALIRQTAADTCTFDNGIENKHHEQLSVPAYFCDPHAPWQKPDVENGIGLLRRWFLPSGTDMNGVSEKELQTYLHVLNGKYRRSLGFRSAYELGVERAIVTKVFVEKKRLLAEKYLATKIALRVRI